MITNVLKVVEA